MTSNRAVAKCGDTHWQRGHQGGGFSDVQLMRGGDQEPYIGGTIRCGNPWQCAICSEKNTEVEGRIFRRAVKQHRAGCGQVYAVTLTIPHDDGDELRPMQRHISRAWGSTRNGAPWKRIEEKFGIVAETRTLEITHGPNGVHPHLHAGIFTREPLTREQHAELAGWLYERWCRYVTKPNKETGKVYRRPSSQLANPERPWEGTVGVTLKVMRNSDYLHKWGIAREMLGAVYKEGRAGHRNYWQILRDISRTNRPNDRKLWREYADATKGAKLFTSSKTFKALFARIIADENAKQRDIPLDTQLANISGMDWKLFVSLEWQFQRERQLRAISLDPLFELKILDIGAAGRAPPECQLLVDEYLEALHEGRGQLWQAVAA
jgi:hypothetical protein